MEIRCDAQILFGIIDRDTVEFKCRSHRCGAGDGVVVLHRFSVLTGEMVGTSKYKNPKRGST